MSPEPAGLVWYFAYGSNVQSATLRGRRGIAYRRAVPVRAPGWRLVFDKPSILPEMPHGSANIRREAGAVAVGVAFEMTLGDLEHVELTEGVPFGNYTRVMLEVEPLVAVPDGPRAAASLASERSDPARRPSTRYMELVIAGALEHGLPAEHLDFLRAVPAEPEHPDAARLRAALGDWMRRR